jgi:hypothetical protein
MDPSLHEVLLNQLREKASADPATNWFPVVSDEAVTFVETCLDVKIPSILKLCYTQISNGGFGPGYQLTGLPGGHLSSWGDLLQSTNELRQLDECEEEWLPLIDWGCNLFSIVDCSDRQIVTLYEGEFHAEGYSLKTLFRHWIVGEIPDLSTGKFIPMK